MSHPVTSLCNGVRIFCKTVAEFASSNCILQLLFSTCAPQALRFATNMQPWETPFSANSDRPLPGGVWAWSWAPDGAVPEPFRGPGGAGSDMDACVVMRFACLDGAAAHGTHAVALRYRPAPQAPERMLLHAFHRRPRGAHVFACVSRSVTLANLVTRCNAFLQVRSFVIL